MQKEIDSFFKNRHYKNIFMIGVYSATIAVAILSMIFNFFTQNYFSLKINLLYLALLLISLYFFLKNQDICYGAISVFWISTFIELLFLLSLHADINLIYIILLPIILYMILPFKKFIFHLAIFYILIFIALYYEVSIHKDSFLHNKKYLFNFIIANLVILFNGFLYNLVINRFIKNLQKTNKEKNILLKELHHRVKNNLNLISSILGLSALKSSNKEAKEILKANEHRIKSMAIVHEILYKDGNLDKMSLKKYIKEITGYILEAEDEQANKKIELKLDIDDIIIDINSLIFFGILVNELITNSIKHSFREDKNYKIVISFKKVDNRYLFRYFDNTQKVDIIRLKEGFGSDLISLAIMQLKGELEVDSKDGLEYRVFFNNEVVSKWQK